MTSGLFCLFDLRELANCSAVSQMCRYSGVDGRPRIGSAFQRPTGSLVAGISTTRLHSPSLCAREASA